MLPDDPFVISGLLLIAFCGAGAALIALLPVVLPGAAATPFLPQLFKLLAFLFSVGAMAVIFRALG